MGGGLICDTVRTVQELGLVRTRCGPNSEVVLSPDDLISEVVVSQGWS